MTRPKLALLLICGNRSVPHRHVSVAVPVTVRPEVPAGAVAVRVAAPFVAPMQVAVTAEVPAGAGESDTFTGSETAQVTPGVQSTHRTLTHPLGTTPFAANLT